MNFCRGSSFLIFLGDFSLNLFLKLVLFPRAVLIEEKPKEKQSFGKRNTSHHTCIVGMCLKANFSRYFCSVLLS